MKIDGLSNYLANSLQTISDLNLKDGQIIMGKVINMAMDEALLEIAGRSMQAKVEGDPPVQPGTVATFQVGKDEAGRVVLKFIANASDISGNNVKETNPEAATKTAMDAAALKNIRTALQREGLTSSADNIAKIWGNLQEFQAKYQQPVSPQVFAFILARKWPVTPGTILTAMVFQNPEARDALWNTLQKSMPDKELTELITKYALSPQAGPETLTGKMAAFSDSKNLQNFLEQLFKLSTPTGPDKGQAAGSEQAKTDLKSQPAKITADTNPPASRPMDDTSRTQPGGNKEPVIQSKNDSPQALDKSNVLDRNLIVESKAVGMSGKLGQAEQQKIAAVLEQHITLSKSLPANDPAAGPSYSIPFLMNDPKNGLRELLVKWRDEQNTASPKGKPGQMIYVAIPTDNMGEVHLSLRVTETGTGVNFKVNTQEIRQYLLNHIAELKETIGRSNAAIVVGLKDTGSIDQSDAGFDLWM